MPVKGLQHSRRFTGRWWWSNRSGSSHRNFDHTPAKLRNNRQKALTLSPVNGIVPAEYHVMLSCQLAFISTDYREGT